MNTIFKLQNSIQNYDWGSHDAIAELLGQPVPSEKPQAELWMGAHPKAPSRVHMDDGLLPLPGLIAQNPTTLLGPTVAARFDGKLPFLFKVLSAARGLSIQAHPSLAQAREGFARENALGIPLDAPNRNYRDDNHKPEIICALTPFVAMNGFRRLPEMVELLQAVGATALKPELDHFLTRPDAAGLRQFFSSTMTMEPDRQRQAVAEVVAYAAAHEAENLAFEWIVKLAEQYPGDIGLLSPLLLNVIKLDPGQAMYSQAQQLHAYLHGTGIELMANSDNVLRGGLTSKHVDVPELLRTLKFEEAEVVVQTAQPRPGAPFTFASPADEFRLSLVEIGAAAGYSGAVEHSVEVWLCTQGEVRVVDGAGEALLIRRGESFLVPAAEEYRIEGAGVLFRASVPDA